MTSIINETSFIASNEQPEHGFWVEGTVEVTLRGETRRVRAKRRNDEITAYGMTGRYQTGTKAWPAAATRVVDPRTGRPWDRIRFGRDDRSGKFNKVNCVFFAD